MPIEKPFFCILKCELTNKGAARSAPEAEVHMNLV